MAPSGLLLLLEEPRVPFDISGANVRAMIIADTIRRKLKFQSAKLRHKLKLKAGESLHQVGPDRFVCQSSAATVLSNKRSREGVEAPDNDAMDVDVEPVVERVEKRPSKRGRPGSLSLPPPRSTRDRSVRFPAVTMRICNPARNNVYVRQGVSGGPVQIMVRARPQPLQPAIQPQWRLNDKRPKFTVAEVNTVGPVFHTPCFYHYALRLTLHPENIPRHAGLLEHPNVRDVYLLPIDTADCTYWFLQDNFEIIQPSNTDMLGEQDYPLPDPPLLLPPDPAVKPLPAIEDAPAEEGDLLLDNFEDWYLLGADPVHVAELGFSQGFTALVGDPAHPAELEGGDPGLAEDVAVAPGADAAAADGALPQEPVDLEIQVHIGGEPKPETGDDDTEPPEQHRHGPNSEDVPQPEAGSPAAEQPELAELPEPRNLLSPKKTIPPGDETLRKGTGSVAYLDSGNVELSRWDVRDSSIPMRCPSWDWNTSSGGTTLLEFPRILAPKASAVIASQPVDGNLGLGVPGWRETWQDAQPEDQVTFFDILQHNNQSRVDKPWMMTLRLLWPQEHSADEEVDNKDSSFVYFGGGSPCAMLGPGDTANPPQWGPPIPIYPDNYRVGLYATWAIRLLSMTLLVPRVENPDYSTDIDWDPIEIQLPSFDGFEGLGVILDTLTSHTIFPPAVFGEITSKWLQDPVVRTINAAPQACGKSIVVSAAYVPHPEVYEDYDLVFKFLGSDGNTLDFRCGAKEFLVSPYRTGDGYLAPFGSLSDEEMAPWAWPRPSGILGANFFWAAMTKLVAPPHEGNTRSWGMPMNQRPYVQLAPQRIIQDGKKVGGPRDIRLYEEFPPWHTPPHHEATTA